MGKAKQRALAKLGRRLAAHPVPALLGLAVPGVRGAVQAAAEAEYKEAAAKLRADRGIVLPADRDPDQCVWCGARRFPDGRGGWAWALEMQTPDCPGHEVLP